MNTITERDLKTIWHPCTQMKDHEAFPLVDIVSASGCYLHCRDGSKIIDAMSSWWCKSLGHGHPILKKALLNQAEQFEHVCLANTSNEALVLLSEKLTQLSPHLKKVWYASEGSSVVEAAIKLSLHAQQVRGNNKRTQFISLQNSYHGETVGAMSVSDVGLYRAPYQSLLFNTLFITPLPYVRGMDDPLWDNCETHWKAIEKQLAAVEETACAIIVEPIVQGAGGMLIYSQDFLKRLRNWCDKHQVYLIADEIMTGLGRTGKWLACEHANIEPDFVCLSKGLTGGWLPMSALLMTQEIYDLFYQDYESGKNFLHSHTFSGNALAASVALAVMTTLNEDHFNYINQFGKLMLKAMQEIADTTQQLKNVRGIGMMVAADLVTEKKRAGFDVFKIALTNGAFLRPIGNTIYWMPPFIMNVEELTKLKQITTNAIIKNN